MILNNTQAEPTKPKYNTFVKPVIQFTDRC